MRRLGAFRDLRSDLPGDPASTYLPGNLSRCATIGGRLLSLPWCVSPQTRIVNRAGAGQGLSPESLPPDWRACGGGEGLPRQDRQASALAAPGEESCSCRSCCWQRDSRRCGPVPTGGRSDLDDPRVLDLSLWADLAARARCLATRRREATRACSTSSKEGRLGVISTGAQAPQEDARRVATRLRAGHRAPRRRAGDLGRVHMPVMVLASSRTRHPRRRRRRWRGS
jgi:hypothetical protein